MSKKISVSVKNLQRYKTKDVDVMSYDIIINFKPCHRVVAKTTNKFKRDLTSKIKEYRKGREK